MRFPFIRFNLHFFIYHLKIIIVKISYWGVVLAVWLMGWVAPTPKIIHACASTATSLLQYRGTIFPKGNPKVTQSGLQPPPCLALVRYALVTLATHDRQRPLLQHPGAVTCKGRCAWTFPPGELSAAAPELSVCLSD